LCAGTRVWRVWYLQSKNNCKVDCSSAAIFYWPFSSVIDRNRNRPFNLIQNKVGYRSCLWLQISYSPHSGTNTKIKWDMCLCILNIILKYAVSTCLWLYWKLTLNTHFLLDFIYFHETIDFSNWPKKIDKL
jgi:hypothetical protein